MSSATTMTALVLRKGEAHLESRAIPTAGPNDVVVRTTTASVCSADLETIEGNFGTGDDCVLGHEAVGVVHEVGPGVTGFDVGERVLVASTTPCGQCPNCQRGFSGHCGGQAWGGYKFGVTLDGSLAEYFTVPFAMRNLVPIPDEISDEVAVCVVDSLATGSTAVEAARLPFGGSVVIFGQGHVGIGATLAVRAMGASQVIAVKARAGREELARAVGADVCLNIAEHDVVSEIRGRTDGQGADLVVEATGVIDSFSQAIASCRIGGVVAVLSSYAGDPDAKLSVPLADWGWGVGDQTILSSFQQAGSERLGRLLALIRTGRIDPTPMVGGEYRFDEVHSALDDVAARRVIKPMIKF